VANTFIEGYFASVAVQNTKLQKEDLPPSIIDQLDMPRFRVSGKQADATSHRRGTSMKRISTHNYQVKPVSRKYSQNAQIQILKDTPLNKNESQSATHFIENMMSSQDDIGSHEETQTKNSTQNQITRLSSVNKTPTNANKKMSQFPTDKMDEEACKEFNSELMRALIARKMCKNKTFYEAKILSTPGGINGFLYQNNNMGMNNNGGN